MTFGGEVKNELCRLEVHKESLPLFGIGLFWLIPAVAGLVIGFILRAAGKKATA